MNAQEQQAAGRGQPRRIMTKAEVEGLNHVLGMEQEMRTEGDTTYRHPAISANGKSAQAKLITKTLAESQPDSLSEHQRNQLESEGKLLEEFLVKNLVPRKYMTMRKSDWTMENTDFRVNATKMAKYEMSQEFVTNAQRWKFIQRQLGRDSSLERLRPKS